MSRTPVSRSITSHVPYALTMDTILQIIGPVGESDEYRLLAAADCRAQKQLKTRRGVIMSDDTDHYRVFEELAFSVFKKWPQAGQAQVDSWDGVRQTLLSEERVDLPSGAPSEAALALYAPQLCAAYYFGLAIGLRLAGSGR